MFLHGYGANKECFLPQINYFSRFYRVTAFDFWGFGKSDPLPAAWSVGEYAEETLSLIEGLHLQRPHIVAHSFGARVAVKMAASEGERLDKLVLTGAAGILLNRGMGYRLKVFSYRTVKKIFPRYAESHFGSEEYKKLSPLLRESYKKIVNEDLRGCAEKIANPTLLIYGKEDKTTPVKAGMVYRNALLHADLCVMEGCGHFAFLDDVTYFNAVTEEFLEKGS